MSRRFLGPRKSTHAISQICIRRLQMNWNWIVYSGLYSFGQQSGLQRVAVGGSQSVDVIDMPCPWHLGGCFNIAVRQQLIVFAHNGTACLGPLFKMAQLHAQYRALETLHAVVVPAKHVMILAILP